MIRQGGGKVPAGLCLFPKEDKYGHSDSIIRSLRIVCRAYAIRPYIGGFAPRPLPPRLSPVGAIWGAYAIRPYKRGCAPRPHPPHLSSVGAICGAYAIRPYIGGCAPRPHLLCLSPIGAIWGGVFNTPLQAGMALGLPFSFSFLDERKGGKRKSRRQGRQPNLPGTGCVYVVYPAIFPSPGRGRQGRQPNLPGTGRGCVCPPPLNGLMRSVIQVCGAAEGARGVEEGRYGACLGLK